MKKFFSLINGEFKQTINVLDRGLSYGDGFFETMVWNSRFSEKKIGNFGVEFWKRHLRRIKKGCEQIKIEFPKINILENYKKKIIKRAIESGLKGGILKIIITRGSGGRGYKFEKNMKPTIIFILFPISPIDKKYFLKGVNVKYCKTPLAKNVAVSGLKHLNRLDSVIASSERINPDIFEGIFLDEKFNLVEGTMTNIFFLKKKTLFTPPINDFGINGIMRQVVIEKHLNFSEGIRIKKINFNHLEEFDAMFLTNSILKILPVKKIEKKKYKIPNTICKIIDYFEEGINLESI